MQYQLSLVRILNSQLGTHINFKVNLKHFPKLLEEQSFKPYLDQEISVDSYRIQDGVCLIIPSQEISGTAIDSSSNKEFETKINSFATEKNYYIKIPDDENKEEVGKINPKSLEVQIDDLLNEALFLNIPFTFSNSKEQPKSQNYSTDKGQNSQKTLKDLFNF